MSSRVCVVVVVGLTVFGVGCFPDPALLEELDDLRAERDVEGPETEGDGAGLGDEVSGPACSEPSDCPATGTVCVVATCINQRCGTANADVACDDENLCTDDDRCTDGVCAGAARTCDAPETCHRAGTCDEGTGNCVYPNETNGVECDDGDRCTAGDACLDGACVSTRSKNDAFGDWVSVLPATVPAQLAALKSTASGFVALVNFQRVDESVASIGKSGDEQGLRLPDGANEGVALLEYAFDGRLKKSLLVGVSEGRARGRSVSVLADGAMMVVGDYEAAFTVSESLEMTVDNGDVATFGLTIRNFQIEPGFIKIDSQLTGMGAPNHAIVGAGDGCVIGIQVQAGAYANVRNQTGIIAQLATPETVALGYWLVWLPGCGEIVGVQRILAAAPNAFMMVTAIDRGADGGVALAGFTTTGLSVAPLGGSSEAILESETARGFALRFDADRRITHSLVTKDDYNNGFVRTGEVRSRDGELWLAYDVSGRATQMDLMAAEPTEIPIPGNPATEFDFLGRALVARHGPSGQAIWTNLAAFDDYDTKTGSCVGNFDISASGRVMTAPAFDSRELVNDVSAPYLAIRAIANGQTIWSAAVVVPVDGEAEGPRLVGATQVAAVLDTESVIVGGTVSGAAELGPPTRTRTLVNDGALGERVFFIRMNSDDGIGCSL